VASLAAAENRDRCARDEPTILFISEHLDARLGDVATAATFTNLHRALSQGERPPVVGSVT
jgi:hypothetical protein